MMGSLWAILLIAACSAFSPVAVEAQSLEISPIRATSFPEARQQPSPNPDSVLNQDPVPPPQLPLEPNPDYPAPAIFPEFAPPLHATPQYRVHPLSGIPLEEIELKNENGLVTIVARNAALADVLNLMSEQYQLSFVFSSDIDQTISISLRRIPIADALTAVLSVGGYTWSEVRGVIHISKLGGSGQMTEIAPEISGRIVRVFSLDFVSAEEINPAVTGMLSPVGNSYILQTDPNDNRKTRESIVVEDLPGSVARIEQYLWQIDVAPRQVMIDVHVLEIDLDDNEEHGVDFQALADVTDGALNLGTIGAQASAVGTFFLELDTEKLDAFVFALQSKRNSKTLASTKILAVNGQEARLQVGQQLGFRVLTTTQTSTLEEVKFLDVGVVLRVTPRISRDGRVLLQVQPEVSSGQINPDTGLPEEETAEVETNVMLPDGKGMVIGGLIQETDTTNVQQVPVLGDLRGVGHLFRRQRTERSRSEVIFVLLPRIVDANCESNQIYAQREIYAERERLDALRGTQSVIDSRLNRVQRDMDDIRQQIQLDRVQDLNGQTYQPGMLGGNPNPVCDGHQSGCQCATCIAHSNPPISRIDADLSRPSARVTDLQQPPWPPSDPNRRIRQSEHSVPQVFHRPADNLRPTTQRPASFGGAAPSREYRATGAGFSLGDMPPLQAPVRQANFEFPVRR